MWCVSYARLSVSSGLSVGDVPMGRTSSVASAPPSAGWSLRAPASNQLDATSLRSSRRPSSSVADIVAAVSHGTPLPVADTPKHAAPRSSKTPPTERAPTRKPTLNPKPRPTRSLFCLTLDNPVRKLCIRIVEYKYPFADPIAFNRKKAYVIFQPQHTISEHSCSEGIRHIIANYNVFNVFYIW